MNYKEKLQQANKEAKGAVVALFLTILVWIIAGFGIAPLNIVVFNTPLWIITGCFGTWIFAIAVAVFMSKFIFKDIDLDDEEINSTSDIPVDSQSVPSSVEGGK